MMILLAPRREVGCSALSHSAPIELEYENNACSAIEVPSSACSVFELSVADSSPSCSVAWPAAAFHTSVCG